MPPFVTRNGTGEGMAVPFGYTHTILDNCVSTGLVLDIFETIMYPCLDPKGILIEHD